MISMTLPLAFALAMTVGGIGTMVYYARHADPARRVNVLPAWTTTQLAFAVLVGSAMPRGSNVAVAAQCLFIAGAVLSLGIEIRREAIRRRLR